MNTYKSHPLPRSVKEKLQFNPTPPAKSKPWGKEWVDAESERRDIRKDAVVNNNPQRDSENALSMKTRAAKQDATSYAGESVMDIRDGFRIHKQGPLEDEYHNQHNVEFYETVTSSEGVEGLLERQNYLDRI